MKRHELTIGANTFYIRRFDPFTAIKVLGDLQREFGGPLLASLKAEPGEAARARGADALFGGLAQLSADMDGAKLERWAKTLLNPDYVAVSIGGAEAKKLDNTAAIQCELTAGEVIELCLASVRYNFEDFIGRLRGLISSAVSHLLVNQPVGSAPN